MREMRRRAAVIMCLVVSGTKKKEKKHQGSGRFDGCQASLSGRWGASSGPGEGWRLLLITKSLKEEQKSRRRAEERSLFFCSQ